MQISLVPLVYVRQPGYGGIEMVGCLPAVGLPALAPYVVNLDLAGTVGTRGIEVIGATARRRSIFHDYALGAFTLSMTSVAPSSAHAGGWARA